MAKSFDFFGNLAVLNFSRNVGAKEKKKIAEELMLKNKSLKTILEKSGRVKGRLRKPELKHLAGEKTKEVLYKENNCVFRFNIDKTYFSPRLSNERKEIALKIKPNQNVLVMFAGVAPFSIVIAKNSKAKKVYSNEINRIANKYAEQNIELNNLQNKVELIPGDIKRLVRQEKIKQKFDVVVMPRPQLKDSFLNEAFELSKKGTIIYYYDFCRADEIDKILEKINLEFEKFKGSKQALVSSAEASSNESKKIKIKILNTKKAGELAPYKIRLRVDFKIL